MEEGLLGCTLCVSSKATTKEARVNVARRIGLEPQTAGLLPTPREIFGGEVRARREPKGPTPAQASESIHLSKRRASLLISSGSRSVLVSSEIP